MRKPSTLCLLVPALFITLASCPASAEPAAGAKGSVKGKVVNAEGKPAAGVPVRLMRAGAGKASESDTAGPRKGRKPGAKRGAGGAGKPEAVAETTADASGEFAFADVEAGKYVVVTRMKGVGAARERVTVTADGPASVTLNLKAASEGKAKAKRKTKTS